MSLGLLRPGLPEFLKNYLPKELEGKPFVTLTYAQSLDSRISKGPGIRTTISHLETKTMTHYLRYHHDGILVGRGTVAADDPGLNCKWGTQPFENSPRPIILDPHQSWQFKGSKMEELYIRNQGKLPILVVTRDPAYREQLVDYVMCSTHDGDHLRIDWNDLLYKLYNDFDIKSVMVEGGASVINQLLACPDIVDSLIVTVGSTYLGSRGVQVSPPEAVDLVNVSWWTGTRDSVLCANLD